MDTSRPISRFPTTAIELFFCLIIALASVAVSAVAQETTAGAGFKFVDGIPYTQGLKGPLLADLYLPNSKGSHPAILFIHGGAWNSGKRTQLKKIAGPLAAAGYVGVAIDYDLTVDGALFPLPLIQSKVAVRWMRAHASEYGIDPDRIAAIGSSAGGEISALLGLTAGKKEYEAGDNLDRSSAVGAVGVLNGVLDLQDLGDDSAMDTEYLGGVCSKKQDICVAASPVAGVHSGAPPFYVGHGTADVIVPYRQAKHFIQRLTEEHVHVTPFVALDAGHTYWSSDLWLRPNLAALEEFLDSSLTSSTVK